MENVIMLKASKFEDLSSKTYMIRYYKLSVEFENFESDQILKALLEYSRYPRNLTKLQRLSYLYEKCREQLSREERENIPPDLGYYSEYSEDYLPF